jgi:hypothetical protein
MDVLNEVVTKGAAIIADKAPETGVLNHLIGLLGDIATSLEEKFIK